MSQRKRYSSEDKVKILREHFEQNLSVPTVCEKHRVHPNQFYRWKKLFFEKAVEIFNAKPNARTEQENIAQLRNQLHQRNEVIAELLQENLKLKKAHGVS